MSELTDMPGPPLPWAKLERNCREQRGRFCRSACSCPVQAALSLIGHSADVAAVLGALLELPTISGRLARLLGKSALAPAECERLTALAALHDLGKINRGFQCGPFASSGRRHGHVKPLVALMEPRRLAEEKAFQRLLEEGGGKLDRLKHVWADAKMKPVQFRAVLAHHGSLPEANGAEATLWQEAPSYSPVHACRTLVEAVEDWFPLATTLSPIAWTPAFEHAFAGLVTLADWLGSDTDYFPLSAPDQPVGPSRFALSVPQARALLRRRGLAPEAARAAAQALPWTSRDLTRFADPSPAQAAMLTLAKPPESGRTCLIEDETGSGKTEAALVHFLDLFRRGVVDGMYFALPTRAAAKQIHRRIEAQLIDLLGDAAPPVTLAVPGYLPDQPTNAPLPEAGALLPDQNSDARWASERPNRYLASWVAIGTIDQVLLGGLRVRHAQLRSSALLRLLLVADEVHSSDPYMTAILRNVLDQHRRAGGHVLLMSATLGSAARAALLQPTNRVPPPSALDAVVTPYPAVWTDAAKLPLSAVGTRHAPPKDVACDLSPNWRTPESAVAYAITAARRGARVLLIRNTVADVVATHHALEAIAPELSLAIEVLPGGAMIGCPHHARYAPEDRVVLDAALEAALGKKAPRRCGLVVVTSQTAEQSLDIDADLLISDLCPADVLLQRIGRLHRHRERDRDHPRPHGFAVPRVVVLAPAEDELAAALTETGKLLNAPLGLGLVYPGLLGVLATRRVLAERRWISVPADNRRLVEAATHPCILYALAQELGGRWMKRWENEAGETSAQAMAATGVCLDWHKSIMPLPPPNERIVTRLGLDDRAIALPPGTMGPFGQKISVLSLPGRWLRGVAFNAEADITATGPGELTVMLGGRAFLYDRHGLRPKPGASSLP